MMNLANAKSITIPEGKVKKITSNGVVLWKSGYKNWVKYSTEADGVTIYNNGLGYKDGYRVRSAGTESALAVATCTGYIPIKAGDVIRRSGYDAKLAGGVAANAINVYDSTLTNLGQTGPTGDYLLFVSDYKDYGHNSVVENPTGVYVWVVPPDPTIAYMRVSGYTNGDGSKMIVTVNEEIT